MIIIEHVYIEVTRRCNLRCAHCLRGDAQEVDLSREDVDSFLKKLENAYISHLVLGGGEPTLNPEIIAYIIDQIIAKKIIVESLAMITNGQIYSDEVANAFNRFDEYHKQKILNKSDNSFISEKVRILFSVDRFHKDILPSVIQSYKNQCKWIRFYKQHLPDESIIKTGRSTIGRDFKYERSCFKYMITKNRDGVFCMSILGIYLTAKGFITVNGNGAYDDIDKDNYGHISDFFLLKCLINNGNPVYNSTNISDLLNTDGKGSKS